MKVNASCALLCDRALRDEEMFFALAYSLCIIVYYCVCTCFDPTGMLHQDKAAFKSMIDNEYQARTAEKNRKIGHFGQNPLPAGELVG